MYQYVFKKSDGSIWNVYYDDRFGNIFIRSYNKRRELWHEPVISIKNAGPHMSCDLDGQDKIHITFTGKKGDIYYGCYDGTTIKPFTVLVSKNPTTYDKKLTVRACRESVYIFYTLRHNDKVLLTLQEVFPEKSYADDPVALDYVTENKSPYRVVVLGKYIYIIYKKAVDSSPDNSSDFILGVKIYSPDEKKVLSFIDIPVKRNIESINSCFIDNDDTLVIFAVTQKGLMEIRALDFLKNTSGLRDTAAAYPGRVETVDITGDYDLNEYFCSGLQLANAKYVYYCSVSNLYVHKSTNRKTYEPVEKYSLSNGRLFLPVYYKSNYPKDSPFLGISQESDAIALPGKISGTPFCHLFNPFLEHEPKAAELGSALLESLNLIKSEISRLEERISEQNKKILQLESSLLNLEKELVKLDIKIKSEPFSNKNPRD